MRETADSKKKEVIKLYLEGENTIKDIMRKAGVKSAHTIYKILDDAKVPRLKVRKPVRQITISIDAKLDSFLKKEQPKNISKWVCDMAKRGYIYFLSQKCIFAM